jgi:hypothetical protein
VSQARGRQRRQKNRLPRRLHHLLLPSNFEGGETQVLSFVEAEELTEEAGLQLTTTNAYEEAIEVNAVV